MTVNEILDKLQQLSADGLGEFQMQFVHMKDDATQMFGFENEYFNLDFFGQFIKVNIVHRMELLLEQVELADNTNNDNTFDVFYDLNTKLLHAFENDTDSPREFVYRLLDTEENIARAHRQEILEYCLAGITINPTDEVGLGDIFLHGKYVERIK